MPRIAYLAGRYPAVSHTFILREVAALRALGVDVDTYSIWRSGESELLGPEERAEAERTFSLLPLRPATVLRAHAEALVRRPGAYVRMLAEAFRLAPSTPRGLMLAASWFVEAAVLWRRCRGRGTTLVHAHLNGTAPSLALLACLLGGEGWTYSMSVHGPTEFYDVHGEALAEKASRAEFVVCISDFARSQLMTLVGLERWPRLHVVHCGVDVGVFRPAERPPDGELDVLCVGRLVRVKGQAVLIDAVAELRRRGVAVRATLVGDGPEREALERRAAGLGLANAVTFTGSLGQPEVRREYERAGAFCLPSFAEGIPVVLMEAMAMEIPVVTTTVAGIGELVEDGVSGLLVRPSRDDQLVDALERLATDPALRERLGRAGREKVEAEFEIGRSARMLAPLFAGVGRRG